MEWVKQGLVFVPSGEIPWMRTHAALPVTDRNGANEYAVYFSSRDDLGRSQIGRLDLNLDGLAWVEEVRGEPVVGLGPTGTFDDSGVTSGCLVNHGGKKYLYYSGWTLGVTVPFYFFIGLAMSEDGGKTFHKVSPAPVLGRSANDAYLTASPSVIVEGGVWRMWYVSCVGWGVEDGRPKHYYHVKYAESADGIRWGEERRVSIDFQGADEYAIGRPCVRKMGGEYRMWYCYRGTSYRIGYAESADGYEWTRRDGDAGIGYSARGWDSEMQAYPWVFNEGNALYMLYNGNGYGKTGFGIAKAAGEGDST
jgi:hypothetical protein